MNDLDPGTFLAIVIGALIVVHIVFGIISARVASGKGRSADLGFWTGFLLNVLGLIIVMLMRPSVEAEARRRVEVEREYERVRSTQQPQRQSGNLLDGRNVVTIHRALDSAEVPLPVTVLSNRDLRARGLSLLARDPTAGGVCYWWPEGRSGRIAFRNNQDLEVCVLAIDAEDVVEEILMLPSHDDADISPTKPVASAIAVSRRCFESLGVDVGDLVHFPDELRSHSD